MYCTFGGVLLQYVAGNTRRDASKRPDACPKGATIACRRWFASFDAFGFQQLRWLLLLHPSQSAPESNASQTIRAAEQE
jgi:hypothetical protein